MKSKYSSKRNFFNTLTILSLWIMNYLICSQREHNIAKKYISQLVTRWPDLEINLLKTGNYEWVKQNSAFDLRSRRDEDKPTLDTGIWTVERCVFSLVCVKCVII